MTGASSDIHQPDTRERILAAAEHLFAAEGLRGASMRAITGAAEVNLAAVNYHFGSKERLLEAVLDRRLTPLNRIRRQRLETVRVRARLAGRLPRVEEVMRAFVEPTLALRESGPGYTDFVALVGRILAEPDETGRTIFLRHMEPFVRQLHELLCEALPHIPPDVILLRLHFSIGALSHIMRNPHGLSLSGSAPPETTSDATAHFVAYVSAGMETAP